MFIGNVCSQITINNKKQFENYPKFAFFKNLFIQLLKNKTNLTIKTHRQTYVYSH